MRSFLMLVSVTAIAIAGVTPSARTTDDASNDKTIAHVLDRVTFGARMHDLERVKRIGVRAYLEQQLDPGRIDDTALEARLDRFETVNLSTREIAERYAIPARQARQRLTRGQGATRETPVQQMRPEVIRNQRLVLSELTEQKLLRAIYSERQLQEVLVDFWFNHFNVFAGKGIERFLLTSYERDVIRPHVFGTFRELIGATAHSPGMLFYLDNWLSVDPKAAEDVAGRLRTRPARRTGLNENYARELMELHTLGVDGGYTQQDIVQVARVFTGWTIDQPRRGAEFRFAARLHDTGDKVVLGHRITSGGEQEGEQVLDILAKHPSTARFISTKLARRFVSDGPPASLVDRASHRFQETDGNLKEVVRTILTSPEFLAPDAYRAKVKTPFEFVVSAIRATGAEVEQAGQLVRSLRELGMPLYMSQPPTGYADQAEAWVNTGALVGRMNFALALAGSRLPGVILDLGRLEGSRHTSVIREQFIQAWLRGDASPTTRETMGKATDVTQLVALAIGSPEFQKR